MLDEFSLNGLRPRRFEGLSPATTWLEHFDRTILHRHYAAGETIALDVAPVVSGTPATIASVSCSIVDARGQTRAAAIPLTPAAGASTDRRRWHSASIYTIAPADPPGKWKAVIEGRPSGAGPVVVTEIQFLVAARALAPRDHPRLLFDAGGLATLRTEARSGELKTLFEQAAATARAAVEAADLAGRAWAEGVNDEFLGGGPFSIGWDDYYRWLAGIDASETANDGALLYALAGDEAAGRKAVDCLLHVARFDTWNHPWFTARKIRMYYPLGYTAWNMAVGYDLLHPLMTDEERAAVRQGILRNGIIPCYQGEVLNNDLPSHFTNHLGVSTGGALAAAMALIGEDPDNPSMEPYLSGILAKFEAHLEAGYPGDGSYVEGFSYQHMDADMMVRAMEGLQRLFGISYLEGTGFADSYLYPLYVSPPTGKDIPDMGDTSDNWGALGKTNLLWLASRNNDPRALALYRRMMGPGFHARFKPDFIDFLWLPRDLQPAPLDDLPPSRWFDRKGNAIFRSGWSENDLIFNFRAGPHSNHYHLDQGNFRIRYGGENLLAEGGLKNYYMNLYYQSFYIQPVAHNTVLIGGYPESQQIADYDNGVAALSTFPRIVACSTGGVVDAVEGRLESVYKNRLDRFSRSFIFVRPDYIVLRDRLAAHKPERFDWLFHAAGDSITRECDRVLIERPKASLRIEILEPARLRERIRKYPDSENRFIDLSTATPAAEASFLAVMIPATTAERAERDLWQTARIEGPGWTGALVRRGGFTDHVIFRDGEGAGSIDAADCETDGDQVVVTREVSGRLASAWVRNATRFAAGPGASGPRARLDSPATFSLRAEGSRFTLEIDSPSAQSMQVTTAEGAAPRTIAVPRGHFVIDWP